MSKLATVGGSKSTVLGCVVATGVVASVVSIKDGKLPPLRVGVGVFLAGGMLLALADPYPEVAGGLAVLLLAGALYQQGIPALRSITSALD